MLTAKMNALLKEKQWVKLARFLQQQKKRSEHFIERLCPNDTILQAVRESTQENEISMSTQWRQINRFLLE